MVYKIHSWIFILLLSNLSLAIAKPAYVKSLFDSKIERILNQANLPGLSIVVVNDKKILYQSSFGYSNKEAQIPYTNQTNQIIGSVSKTFLAVALMKAVEQGLIDLNKDINHYLPFKVIHPLFPNKIITPLHLATHTSGLIDTDVYFRNYIFEDAQRITADRFPNKYQAYMKYIPINKNISQNELLENTLSPQGKWFNPGYFDKYEPGKHFNYSNHGANLTALIIENMSGMPYEEYVLKYIFKPLKMNNTSWDTIESKNLARLYFNTTLIVPKYSLIAKGDGAIISNINDMGLFLIEMIKGLKGKGTLLSKKSYKQIFIINQDTDSKGLFWFNNSNSVYHHNGIEPGASTKLYIFPSAKIGVYLATNINADSSEDIAIKLNQILLKILNKFVY
jgi:CubicO group peptidase (beta-lactamase class C family)